MKGDLAFKIASREDGTDDEETIATVLVSRRTESWPNLCAFKDAFRESFKQNGKPYSLMTSPEPPRLDLDQAFVDFLPKLVRPLGYGSTWPNPLMWYTLTLCRSNDGFFKLQRLVSSDPDKYLAIISYYDEHQTGEPEDLANYFPFAIIRCKDNKLNFLKDIEVARVSVATNRSSNKKKQDTVLDMIELFRASYAAEGKLLYLEALPAT